MGKRPKWPAWWDWELDLTPHLLKRMVDRDFTELDLRRMMEHTVDLRPAASEGRWIVSCRYEKTPWEIVVEPDHDQSLLVVVTAYPLDEDIDA